MSHQKKGQKTTLALKTTLTAHSGINTIGGGVFEITSNGDSILVDCGLNLNTFNSYFMEFMQPRKIAEILMTKNVALLASLCFQAIPIIKPITTGSIINTARLLKEPSMMAIFLSISTFS